MLVEKLHDVEAAAVHIEMDVPLLEIRRACLPYLDLWEHLLHLAPGRLADSLAVYFGIYEEYLQVAMAAVHLDNQPFTR